MCTKSMHRSIMGKKTGLSMHPRKFGNHVTPQAYQCKINESTGMATQMQQMGFFGHPDFFREKNDNKVKCD